MDRPYNDFGKAMKNSFSGEQCKVSTKTSTHILAKKIIILLYVISFVLCNNAHAAAKYDIELLERQLQLYSADKAESFIKEKEYLKAAINILSIYPIDSKRAVYLALSLDEKTGKELPNFLFEAFQECMKSDQSFRFKEDNKVMANANWMDQKARWSDELIGEVICYKRIKDKLNNDEKATYEFFFNSFHTYYELDKNRAIQFLDTFDRNTNEYFVLASFAKASLGGSVDIANLEKINMKKLSDAIKEMLVMLKGSYYMGIENYQKAKESYLEFFKLDYSLPIHIQNLATCYYLTTGSYENAKPLLLYLTNLYRVDNISVNGIYNLSCIFAQEGNKGEAFRYLEKAIKMGFSKSRAKEDADLVSLRNDKRFVEIVGQ